MPVPRFSRVTRPLRALLMASHVPTAAAAALSAASIGEVVSRSAGPVGSLVQNIVLALCAVLPVAFARVWLTASALAVTGAVLLTLVLGIRPTVAALLALAALLGLTGVRGSPRTVLLFAVPYVVYAVSPIESRPGGRPVAVTLLMVAAVLLAAGWSYQSRAGIADRAAATDAYTDMAQGYAARQERARIAREMHDIVAHHISLISVQAETARLTTRDLPAEGARRLLAIGETARQALTEMRRVLDVLRDDASPTAGHLPQPGLGQLITLVDQARSASGSRIWLVLRGRSRPLDPGLELTAYRIVQEALTNVRRHAADAAVDIEVGYDDEALRLHIWNTEGHGGEATPGEGFGLLGMRERVAMAGGTLRTGHSPMGGFVVEAVLPLPPAVP